MAASARFRALWSEDEMVPYPRGPWVEAGMPAPALPEGDEVPLDVAVVYTAYLTGDLKLYDPIRLTTATGSLDIPLIVIGAVPEDHDLLYMLDPGTGDVVLFDLTGQEVQGVNSNYRCFVEFLYRFAQFVEADEGKPDRADKASALRESLAAIDQNAFQEGAWWPMVFDQLMS
ncbi:SUKH-4 family immunity protein [Glycomyces tritici]|uniref:SUKH-4 family immunity protein n=1 Tax=Glycomyces tritici TaxID=2665176 RepID=A0ABT7YXD8_9ACTN|nr:SUKH-4 family immunity protein [Glycomyces tritici]MDN3241290.1 SUKH-4 family immunity protein [Glycomyces tritici]MDN3243313.1 SUKH-4 family immunity protein [Glycomyces tritici]